MILVEEWALDCTLVEGVVVVLRDGTLGVCLALCQGLGFGVKADI